jgi:PilZ domain
MRPVLHAACQRALLRRDIRTQCEVVREHDFRLVGSRVLDLSAKGMLLETDQRVLTGEELIVSFRGPASSRWYDCTGTVARVVHGRRRRDRRRAVGVSFDTLDVFNELLLCEELRDAPVSMRHLASHACAR